MASLLTQLRARPALAWLVLLAIMHLGWLKFLNHDTTFVFDYAERILIIALCLWAWPVTWDQLKSGLQALTPKICLLIVLATISIIAIDFVIDIAYGVQFLNLYTVWEWGHYPKIENRFLFAFDLTVGLVLVAASEELIYRKIASDILVKVTKSRLFLYVSTALIFAAAHIPQGLDSTTNAFFAGVILLFVYRKSGTLWVPVIIHYLANLYFFGLADVEILTRTVG